jgi:hypothetical protein
MKDLFKYEKDLGAEGVEDGSVKAALGVEGSNLVAEVKVGYPIAKIIDPATAEVDKLLEKLKGLIPGDWDNPLIDGFKLEYKASLLKALSEQ